MATVIRAQVTLPSVNSIPRDAAVNTWHFGSGAVDPLDDAAEIFDHLDDFYSAIGSFFSTWCSGDGLVKMYNLADAEPRVPLFTDTFAFTPGTGTALPSECAIALSYKAAPVSGVAQGRRRGRIFLGPLDAAVVDNGTTGIIVDAGVTAAIATAATALRIAGTGGATWDWAVFSPTIAGPPPWTLGDLTAATQTVVAGYVDDAFDTIRSRGTAAENRSVLS